MAEGRVRQLDGLRGIAALAVVLSHLVGALLPSWDPDGSVATIWVAHSPVRTLYDGALAVDIFFVLSGYVIAQSAFRRKMSLPLQLIGRYLRLTLPMLASVLFAVLLLRAFPTALEAMRRTNGSGWLNTFYNSPPVSDWIKIFSEPTLMVYARQKPVLNPVLWTMRYELWGSCGVYVLYALCPGRWRKWVLALAGLALGATGRTQYLDFVLGAAFFEMNRPTMALRRIAGFLILIGFLAAGPFLVAPKLEGFRYSLCAALIVLGVIHSSSAANLLSEDWAQRLGYVSFPLYLLHFPLLFTIFAAIFANCTTPLGVFVTAAAFVFASLGLAHLFARWVDDPVMNCIKVLQRRLSGRMPPPSSSGVQA